MKKAVLLLLLALAVGCSQTLDSSSTSEVQESSSSEIVFVVAENNFVNYLSPDVDDANPVQGLLSESPISGFVLTLNKDQTKYLCDSLQSAELALIPSEEAESHESIYCMYISFIVYYPLSDGSGNITINLFITNTGTVYFLNDADQLYKSDAGAVDYQFYIDYINNNQ